MCRQICWCIILLASAVNSFIVEQDGDSGIAVLHTEGNRTAVTIHMPDGKSSVFYFPGSTRLIQPCTSPIDTCPDLALDVIFKEQGSQRNAVIMAKFVDAIGFMELQCCSGGSDVVVVASEVVPIPSEFSEPCHPLDITNQRGEWFFYCIIQSQYVLECAMTVNFTNYTNTELSCRYLGDADILKPSRFLYVPDFEYVFFTDRSELYRIDLNSYQLGVFTDLSSSSCRQLNYLPHSDLTLYCGSGVASEVGFDRIEHVRTLNATGITFACEESDQIFVVRQRHFHVIEIGFNNLSVTLNVTNFLDAKCIFKKGEAFIFVLDAYTGVSVLTGASTYILPVVCTATGPCRSIQLYLQPTGFSVLVLKEHSRHIEAIVFDRNLHEVLSFELRGPFAGFATLDFLQTHNPSFSTMETDNDMVEEENDKSSSDIHDGVIAGIVCVVAFILVIAILVIIVVYIKKSSTSCAPSAHPIAQHLPPFDSHMGSSYPQPPQEAELTSTDVEDSTVQENIGGPGDLSAESAAQASPPTNRLQQLQFDQAMQPYQSDNQSPVMEPQPAVDGGAIQNQSPLESHL